MDKTKRTSLLSPVFLGMGVVAMVLHRWLFTYVEDEIAWLLPAFTLPEILLWVLMAIAAIAALVLTRRTVLKPEGKVFPAVSSVLMAGGIATLLLEDVTGPEALVRIYHWLCILAVPCLVAAAFYQGTERKVPFLLELPNMVFGHFPFCVQGLFYLTHRKLPTPDHFFPLYHNSR